MGIAAKRRFLVIFLITAENNDKNDDYGNAVVMWKGFIFPAKFKPMSRIMYTLLARIVQLWCAGEQESELLELFFTTIITQKNGNETGSRPNSELIKGGSFH